MKKIISISLIGLVSLFFVPSSTFAALDANEIISKANIASYYQGTDGRAKVTMKIVDQLGRERTREFTILRMDLADGGEQKFYVFFHKPADVRKTVFMVWKHPAKDDDRWLYLPALDLVRRISASDKRSSFVGSHFLYEDVSGRNPGEDTHELLDEEGEFYHLKSTPKDPGNVEFAYYETWIRKDHFLPVKSEYYNTQGEKYRTVEALEIQDVQGHPTVMRAKVSDLISGGFTESVFEGVQYDLGLTEDIFTERYLRREPRQWLSER